MLKVFQGSVFEILYCNMSQWCSISLITPSLTFLDVRMEKTLLKKLQNTSFDINKDMKRI